MRDNGVGLARPGQVVRAIARQRCVEEAEVRRHLPRILFVGCGREDQLAPAADSLLRNATNDVLYGSVATSMSTRLAIARFMPALPLSSQNGTRNAAKGLLFSRPNRDSCNKSDLMSVPSRSNVQGMHDHSSRPIESNCRNGRSDARKPPTCNPRTRSV